MIRDRVLNNQSSDFWAVNGNSFFLRRVLCKHLFVTILLASMLLVPASPSSNSTRQRFLPLTIGSTAIAAAQAEQAPFTEQDDEPGDSVFLPLIYRFSNGSSPMSEQTQADDTVEDVAVPTEARGFSDYVQNSVMHVTDAAVVTQPTKQKIDDFAKATGEFPNSDYPLYTRPNLCGPPNGIGEKYIPDGWFYVDFRSACNNHDICGSTLGNSKQTCDNKFFDDLREAVRNGLRQPTRDIPNIPFVNPLFPVPSKAVTGLFSGTYRPTPLDFAIYAASGAIPSLGPSMTVPPRILWPIGFILPRNASTIEPTSLAQGDKIAEFYFRAVVVLGHPSYNLRQEQAEKYKSLVDSFIKFFDGGAITREVMGSNSPTTLPNAELGETITNGDFSIVRTGDNTILGDGIDDETAWTFDYSQDIRFISDVMKADLDFNLVPKSSAIYNDEVAIVGLARISTPAVQSLPLGQEKTVSLNLLDFYKPSDIARIFNTNNGRIPMFFRDDAIVSRARLLLSVKSGLSQGQCDATPAGALIRNGGFEGIQIPWRFYTNGAGVFTLDTDSYECSQAANVTISSEGSNVQLYQEEITLQPDTTYSLRLVARSNSAHDISLHLHKHGEPYTNYGLKDAKLDLTYDWKVFNVQFTTSGFTESVSDARLRLWLAPYDTAGDQYWFDDIVMQPMDVITSVSQPVAMADTAEVVSKLLVAGYNIDSDDGGQLTGAGVPDVPVTVEQMYLYLPLISKE